MNQERSARARIGIPTATSHAYLFVDPENRTWDPWWRQLLDYLLALAEGVTAWSNDEERHIAIGDVALTGEQKVALWSFLRTAPEGEAAGHKTLRRAMGISVDAVDRITLMLFRSTGSVQVEPGDA